MTEEVKKIRMRIVAAKAQQLKDVVQAHIDIVRDYVDTDALINYCDELINEVEVKLTSK